MAQVKARIQCDVKEIESEENKIKENLPATELRGLRQNCPSMLASPAGSAPQHRVRRALGPRTQGDRFREYRNTIRITHQTNDSGACLVASVDAYSTGT